ncbi:MAG: PfkB family carbohydrate kinase, partial [Pseudomonadota bacterium]
ALAKAAQLKVAYAAAPFIAETTLALLPQIDLLAVNEGEARALGDELGVDPVAIPVPHLLITKGAKGSVFIANGKSHRQSAFKVTPVDTTGAGDTFLGAFLAHFTKDEDAKTALRFAAAASAIQVTREGAAPAIPQEEEVLQFMKEARTV